MKSSIALGLLAVSISASAVQRPTRPAPTAPTTVSPAATTPADAATATANSATNDCSKIKPFYWEVGDSNASKVGGSVGGTTYTQTTAIGIASASKWIYSTYVEQMRGGVLSSTDLKFLNFKSGYTNFGQCVYGQTIAQCANYATNGLLDPADENYFDYDGGHMEKHAELYMAGMGAMKSQQLTAAVNNTLGINIAYGLQLAGGVTTSAAEYAGMLRKLMRNDLVMGLHLADNAVCTNPKTCSTAKYAPIPTTESWHYGVGHWIEDDPKLGDGSFSSPGAFGFYPWISADKSTYGVVSRKVQAGAWGSVLCGRAVRKAYMTGIAQ